MSWESAALRRKRNEIARFIDPVSGIRFYPVPRGDELVCLPGATSLLGFVAPQKTKDVLTAWREREVAAGRNPDHASNRGTAVHTCLERIVRGEPAEPDNEEVAQFLEGMAEPLDHFDSFVWSERPLKSGWEHCWNTDDTSHPDRLARVWSWELGASGTPDLVGVRNGKHVLVDYKTSKRPYVQLSPGERMSPNETLGFKSYKKCVRQQILYGKAIEETLGIHIDEYEIIVGLRDGAQHIVIPSHEIERETHTVLALASEFWRRFEELQSADLALV